MENSRCVHPQSGNKGSSTTVGDWQAKGLAGEEGKGQGGEFVSQGSQGFGGLETETGAASVESIHWYQRIYLGRRKTRFAP